MANTLQKFEARQLEKLTAGKEMPHFSVGDTLKVNIKIKEGERERVRSRGAHSNSLVTWSELPLPENIL